MDDWIDGSRSIQFFFNKTEGNKNIKLFEFPDEKSGGISYEKVRDEIARDLDLSDITATDLQDEILGPIIPEGYREQVTKVMREYKYMAFLSGNTSSMFQDIESYLRTEIDLVEGDIRLVLDDYISSFLPYEISPGIYTFKGVSKVLLSFLQSGDESYRNSVVFKFDYNNMKTELIVRPGNIAIRFDEKTFFSTV